jgi:hypothetical protein
MSDLSKRLRSDSESVPPLEYTHKGQLYIRGDVAAIDNDRYKSSWWSFGTKYALITAPTDVAGWYCGQSVCESRFLITTRGAAHIVQRHMEDMHNMKRKKGVNEMSATPNSSQPDGTSFTGSFRSLSTTLSSSKFQAQILRWFILDHIPLAKADSVEFVRLLKLCNPSIEKMSLSRQSLRRWAEEAYQAEKDKIRKELAASLSRIHISFDLWTSPNKYAVFGAVAHFVRSVQADKTSIAQNHSVLLGLKRMRAGHTHKDQADILVEIIDDFKIRYRLGVFQSDNPSVNDLTVNEVLARLRIAQDGSSRRARCVGHILNLSARDMLIGKDVDAFEFEIAGEGDMATKFNKAKMQAAQEAWQRKGPVGKLHNTVVFIRSSTVRLESFKRITIDDAKVDGKWCLFIIKLQFLRNLHIVGCGGNLCLIIRAFYIDGVDLALMLFLI